MRITAFTILAAVVLVLGAGAGWYWWTEWRFQQATDDAYVQSDITVISPKIEGYLKEVRVEDNQEVAAGQVLLVVDDRDFAAKVQQAAAAVATEEAIVATFGSRLKFQRAMIEQAAILCGGRGSRLGPLTADLPKPLLAVDGAPFLDVLLTELGRHGIRRILLLAGFAARTQEKHKPHILKLAERVLQVRRQQAAEVTEQVERWKAENTLQQLTRLFQ